MTTVALIGSSGFIGSNLTAELVRSDFEVATLGRLSLATRGQTERELDAVQPDVVIHLASNLVPGSSELAYLDEKAQLGSATVALANRLAERNILLVFLSSGGAVYGPQPGATLSENRDCAPISFYGQEKLEVESYIKFAERSLGLRYLVLRPSNPYGPGQDPRKGQGLISVIIDRALRREPLEVWGDGSVVRDYIHVQDLCGAMVHLLNKGVEGQTVNIGSGTGHSLLEVVDIVEQNLGAKISLSFKEARPVDSPRAVLDITRMLEHGVPEPRSLDSGVRSYVEHLRGSK
jgi:UDP-glucose 4-epimerase